MAITTITSREFNQDVSKAKRVAASGPVFIADRGHPAHVLLTIEQYRRITKTKGSIVELLAIPAATDIEFDTPKLDTNPYQPEDFS